MGSQVYYRKYRAQSLSEFVGQEQVTRTLANAFKSGRISHAYLFCGPRGTGKTSAARILAKAVNCLNNGKGEPCNTCSMCQAITEGRALDVIEIDAASNTGVDNIRDLREKVNYAPNEARYKVYIIDEVHMLSTSASNALLKTLEEPPPHAMFVLATTETHKVLPTIISRCQRFDFHRLSQTDIVKRLTQVIQAEGINITPDGLRLIAGSATGSLRDALNLLEQLTTYYGTDIELAQIKAILGITGDWRAKELVKQIVNNDITGAIKTVHSVNNDGLDLKQFTREIASALRTLMLVKTNVTESLNLTGEDIISFKEMGINASLSQIIKAVKAFNQIEIGMDNYSTMPLELALVDSIQVSEEKKMVSTQISNQEPVKPTKETLPASEIKTKAAKTDVKPVAVNNPPPPTEEKHHVQTVEDSPVTSTLGSEVERLKQNWKQILDNAPVEVKRTNAVALLRSSRPVEIQGDKVTLSFRYKIHKENIEKPENIIIAVKLVSDYLGRSCKVVCIYRPEDNHLVKAALEMGAQVTSVEEK
ncbi:MAG: DNA polymerase III subunit gamma/tau [Dehalococcoidales bacterium]|nr:DNA polymerase III subunit gamma/tau [Dehalococcoidales bacterium]